MQNSTLHAAHIIKLRQDIESAGRIIEQARKKSMVKIQSHQCLTRALEDIGGLYWIETTMEPRDIIAALSSLGRTKKIRKTPPDGVGIIQRDGARLVIYSGTGHAIRTRLFEHLFNYGNQLTTKLSLEIDKLPFSNHDWYISWVAIEDYPSRYALEAWWRISIGWPPFCIK
jgi:hypothetical protein